MKLIPKAVIDLIFPNKQISDIGMWNLHQGITNKKSNTKIEGMK